jgi:hypothetical protein
MGISALLSLRTREEFIMRKLFIGMLVCSVVFITFRDGYTECEGDINCSGAVDGSDLAALAADFGTTGCGSCDDVIARMEGLENKVAMLEELLEHFTRDGNNIYIEGANLHIRNGNGRTDSGLGFGLGNLIVGYNELRGSGSDDRTGSHNIVVGRRNNYSSYGGLVVGNYNWIFGAYSSVCGGTTNEAIGDYSSVSGGQFNKANGNFSSVSGGIDNTTDGLHASISGGYSSEAKGQYSSVSGGSDNIAEGICSSVSGGHNAYIFDIYDWAVGWCLSCDE